MHGQKDGVHCLQNIRLPAGRTPSPVHILPVVWIMLGSGLSVRKARCACADVAATWGGAPKRRRSVALRAAVPLVFCYS
jgi:hypothetical protein